MEPSSPKPQRNPTWSRDELILALELYLKHRDSLPSKHHPEIKALSTLLGQVGKVLGLNSGGSFRNENGVYMKLGNFRRCDPDYLKKGKTGLAKGNKDESLVWAEFADDPAKLNTVATTIRIAIENVAFEPHTLSDVGVLGITEAVEGKLLTRLHSIRERSRALVEAKKKEEWRKHGCLKCEACSFDFSKTYGEVGDGIIDVHHTKPIHTLKPGERTRLSELALLCANCHRVVHSRRKWLSVEQVRALLTKGTGPQSTQ